jgi:hypothetical protein
VQSALTARSKKVFATNYYDDEYRARIQPIKDLPYFIVILSAISFKETRDTEIFIFTLFMFLVFFIFQVLVLYSAIYISYKKPLALPDKYFVARWIMPKAGMHSNYKIASIYNVGLVILLILFFKSSTFAEYFIMLALAITFTTLFPNFLFLKSQNDNTKRNLKYQLKNGLFFLVLIVVINVSAGRVLENFFCHFFFFEIAWLMLGIFLYYGDFIFSKLKFPIINDIVKEGRYKHCYTLMSITRLILTSGIPVIFFYTTSYNYEQNLLARYRLLDFTKRLVEKFPSIDKEKFLLNPKDYKNAIYIDHTWVHDIRAIDNPVIKPFSNEDNKTAEILNVFRYTENNDSDSQENDLYSSASADSSFLYNHLFNQTNGGSRIYNQTKLPGQYLAVSSSPVNYKFPYLFSFRGGLFWLSLTISLALFYFIIFGISKNCLRLICRDPLRERTLKSRLSNLLILTFVNGVTGEQKY